MVDSEQTFDGNVESIKRLYRQYSAEELAAALFVSNLWLPNIASYAKHTLFAMTLSSMKPEEFQKTSAMNELRRIPAIFGIALPTLPKFHDAGRLCSKVGLG